MVPDCCKPKNNPEDGKKKGIIQGIIYGTIPHAGCIAFIIFSLLGVSVAASLFRPLLAKAYFFYIMVGLSLVFATFSASLYLRKHGGINTAKHHKGYLTILYGSTIGISLFLYMVVFPVVVSASGTEVNSEAVINLKVKIPCPGHAPLITTELEKLNGVEGVEFSFPNEFKVGYDANKVSKEKILDIKVFEEYPAEVLDEEIKIDNQQTSSEGCCGGPSCGSAQTGVCGCGS